MSSNRLLPGTVIIAVLPCAVAQVGLAGMPAPLPTPWTDGSPPEGYGVGSGGADALWQGVSFFVFCLFGTAAVVKWLWNVLRRDLTALPRLSYGRSLSFVLLWGFAFVIVLTMISGARELMTPGAWTKQGWTYTLESEAVADDSMAARQQSLEELRMALWHHAATHGGDFPGEAGDLADPDLWSVPGWAGFRFLYVRDQSADDSGRLLVIEPDTDGGERLVLLTNGMIGTMRSADIEQALAGDLAP